MADSCSSSGHRRRSASFVANECMTAALARRRTRHSVAVQSGSDWAIPERVASVMEPLGVWWAIAGGWAIDRWLGRVTRDHHDVEIAIQRHDQAAVHRELGAARGHVLHRPARKWLATVAWRGHLSSFVSDQGAPSALTSSTCSWRTSSTTNGCSAGMLQFVGHSPRSQCLLREGSLYFDPNSNFSTWRDTTNPRTNTTSLTLFRTSTRRLETGCTSHSSEPHPVTAGSTTFASV